MLVVILLRGGILLFARHHGTPNTEKDQNDRTLAVFTTIIEAMHDAFTASGGDCVRTYVEHECKTFGPRLVGTPTRRRQILRHWKPIRFYLVIIIQILINYAQNVQLVKYNQTVQLVFDFVNI